MQPPELAAAEFFTSPKGRGRSSAAADERVRGRVGTARRFMARDHLIIAGKHPCLFGLAVISDQLSFRINCHFGSTVISDQLSFRLNCHFDSTVISTEGRNLPPCARHDGLAPPFTIIIDIITYNVQYMKFMRFPTT
ncbi:hypothetical protein HS125_10575 [bacterium]|nr:hypothetical protein [bacterium]